jgi:hypothetical protein
MACGALVLHWVLFLGWGLAMNEAGGYLYCRLVMPEADFSSSGFPLSPVPWLFTIAGLVLLLLLGIVDRQYFRRSIRVAFYPLPLFAVTQLLLLYLSAVWAIY